MASRSRKAAAAAAAAAAAKSKKGGGAGRSAHEDQFMAAAIGDVEWLRQSLKESGVPGAFDRNGLAAVHLAAIHGRLECLRLLIEQHRCDVNSASGTGWRPIHLCISAQTGPRSLQCLLYLLDRGADHSCVNEDLVTPVHQAASEGHLQALQLLIKLGAKLDQTDVRGFRPIDMAKIWGHQKCARLLAAETWHREKDQVAKKLHMEKRVAMRELLRQFEREEQIPGDLRYQGREDFNAWVEQVGESKSGHKKRHTHMETRDLPQHLQTSQAPAPTAAVESAAGISPPTERYRQPMDAAENNKDNRLLRARVREVIDEANEILGEGGVGDGDGAGGTTPHQLSAKRPPPPLRLVQHQQDWNHSTKVSICFHPYQKSLEDVYPRDNFTRMPHPRNSFPLRLNALSSHPEAALAGEDDRRAMLTVGRERLAEVGGDEGDGESEAEGEAGETGTTRRRPQSSRAAQPSDRSGGQSREQLFAAKSVLDIQRRKRFDELVRKYRGEAAAHLCSDARSFLFRDALGLEPLPAGDPADAPSSASASASTPTASAGSRSRSLRRSSRLKSPHVLPSPARA